MFCSEAVDVNSRDEEGKTIVHHVIANKKASVAGCIRQVYLSASVLSIWFRALSLIHSHCVLFSAS